MLKLRINYALVFSLLLLNFTGCVSGTPPAEQYTSPSGIVTPIATEQESCKRACNADFSRCSGSNASRRSASDNAPAQLLRRQRRLPRRLEKVPAALQGSLDSLHWFKIRLAN